MGKWEIVPEETLHFDDMKKIIIRRITRNYIRHHLDTLCLAFGQQPEQLDERIWLTAEYQKWARNERLSEDELERLMNLAPVSGLLDCLEAQAMLNSANLPEAPPPPPPKKNKALIIAFPQRG